MRRRWIADEYTPPEGHPTRAALTGEQAAHLARVLRAEVGQVFDVVAGGFLHRAEISSVKSERVEFVLHEELSADAALPLHLLLAVFKFDHLEWAIEKATELGVERITPVLARRTEKHLAQAAVKRVERWRRIAHEAAQQSRRTAAPTIADPSTLRAALEAETAELRVLLSETEQRTTLSEALRKEPGGWDEGAADVVALPEAERHREGGRRCALAIGPEGGWAPEEMELFGKQGWTAVTLGPRILRAETAAIAAVAIAGTVLG